MNHRHKRNAAIAPWICAVIKNGGSLLIGAHEQGPLGLYHLGALWARQRGLLICHGTVDIISGKPRRYAYTLTPKGKRAALRLMAR